MYLNMYFYLDGTLADAGELTKSLNDNLYANYGTFADESELETLVKEGLSDKATLKKDKSGKKYIKNLKTYLQKVFNQKAEADRYFGSTRRGDLKNQNLKEFKKKEFYINQPNALAGNNDVMDQFRPDDILYKPDIDNGQKNDDPISFKKKCKQNEGKVTVKYNTVAYSGLSKKEANLALYNRLQNNDDDAFSQTRKVSEKSVNLKYGSLQANMHGRHYKVKKREKNEKIDTKLVESGALQDEPWQSLYE